MILMLLRFLDSIKVERIACDCRSYTFADCIKNSTPKPEALAPDLAPISRHSVFWDVGRLAEVASADCKHSFAAVQ